MKNTIILSFFIFSVLFLSCKEEKSITPIATDLKTIELNKETLKEFEIAYSDSTEKNGSIALDTVSFTTSEYICGTTSVPKYLKELNMTDVYTSNVTLNIGSTLSAYGFSGKMEKKDLLIVAYLTKYKDYTCGTSQKRAAIGLKLYVHASELKINSKSPTLPMVAAAVELGLAKAEYRFQTFGISPDDYFSKLPSAQFTVDTYSKVISSYDNIIHSLNDSTVIDPIISKTPKL